MSVTCYLLAPRGPLSHFVRKAVFDVNRETLIRETKRENHKIQKIILSRTFSLAERSLCNMLAAEYSTKCTRGSRLPVSNTVLCALYKSRNKMEHSRGEMWIWLWRQNFVVTSRAENRSIQKVQLKYFLISVRGSGSLNLLGPVQAWNGIALPFLSIRGFSLW
jgi:hypothetical protein